MSIWRCWIKSATKASHVILDQGNITGAYNSEEDAFYGTQLAGPVPGPSKGEKNYEQLNLVSHP